MAFDFSSSAVPAAPIKSGSPALRWIRVRHLAFVAVLYGAALLWVHALVRSPLNLDYFTRYVTLRCSARHTAGVSSAATRDELAAVARAVSDCQQLAVAVDDVWGGIYGKPSVRLRVVSSGRAEPEYKYYAVDVDPVLGIASIAYDLSPALYYMNF